MLDSSYCDEIGLRILHRLSLLDAAPNSIYASSSNFISESLIISCFHGWLYFSCFIIGRKPRIQLIQQPLMPKLPSQLLAHCLIRTLKLRLLVNLLKFQIFKFTVLQLLEVLIRFQRSMKNHYKSLNYQVVVLMAVRLFDWYLKILKLLYFV